MGCCDSRPQPANQTEEKNPIKRPKFKRKSRYKKPNTVKISGETPETDAKTPRRSTRIVSRGSFILNVPEPLRENYTIIKKLHDKPDGIIAIARDKRTNMQRVVKEVRIAGMEYGESEKFMERVDCLKELVKLIQDHPNIVKIYEIVESSESFYFVQEFLMGDSLSEKLSRNYLSESLTCKIAKSLLEALAYSHSRDLVHKNLHPDNVLFDSKSTNAIVKLNNFGLLSKMEKQRSNIDSLQYLAPEFAFKSIYNDPASDMWSIGVLVYLMIIGKVPFLFRDDDEFSEAIALGLLIPEEIIQLYSKEVKDFIEKLIVVDPKKRMTAVDALKHKWFTKFKEEDKQILMKEQEIQFICDFYKRSKLEKGIFSFVTSQASCAEEEKEYMELFKFFDVDKNGSISKDELISGIKKIGTSDNKKLEKALDSLKIEKDCLIDFSEFLAAISDWESEKNIKKIENAFLLCEKNGKGHLSIENIKHRVPGIPDEEWDKFFEKLDENKDNVISIDEFKQCFLSKSHNAIIA